MICYQGTSTSCLSLNRDLSQRGGPGGAPAPQHPWWWLRRERMWGVSWPPHASSSRLCSSGNTPPRLPSPWPLACCSQPAGCGGRLASPPPILQRAACGTEVSLSPCARATDVYQKPTVLNRTIPEMLQVRETGVRDEWFLPSWGNFDVFSYNSRIRHTEDE